uniref:STI1 domain-containing protein n=1 Tax=Corethron hystrix TaxID=216773 RepID=A0A7S1BMR0_9STRA
MDRVRSSPHLLERLSDPRYAAALEEMRVDPGRAKKKYQDVPEMINFFRDFCGVVGDHFMQLDAAQKREQGRRSYENGDGVEIQAKSRNVGEDVAIRELGKGNFTTTPQNDADAAKVDAILQDREMAEMLMDPEMKKVMADCSRPGAMRAFMSHPKWGPKLRKMIDHGLLQVA